MATSRLVVVTPVGDAPLRRFMGWLPFELSTGEAGDRPRVDVASTRLTGTLSDHAWDALAQAPNAQVAPAESSQVRVTLDAPRLVERLRTAASSGRLELFRLDGSTFAAEPTTTTTASGGLGGVLGEAAVTGSAGALGAPRVRAGGPERFRAPGSGAGGGQVVSDGTVVEGGQVAKVAFGSGTSHPVPGAFVDADFGVRGASSFRLAGVHVRSAPAGVAMALVPAGTSPEEAVAAPTFWRAPRPGAQPVDDLGPALATAVQDLLDDLVVPLPGTVSLAVAVTADGPCVLDVAELVVPHTLADEGFAPLPLVRSDVVDPEALVDALRGGRTAATAFLRTFLDDAPKSVPPGQDPPPPTRTLVDTATTVTPALVDRVLVALSAGLETTPLWHGDRFDATAVPGLAAAATAVPSPTGERLVRLNRALLEVALPGILHARTAMRDLVLDDEPAVVARRPPGGPVVSAILPVVADPDGGSAVDAGEDSAQAVGAEVTGAGWVAGLVSPATPVRAIAVEVLLVGTGAATEVVAELREDHDGLPRGRVVARGTARVGPGGAGWVRVALPTPVVVPTRDHWLALRAGAGRAVWLAAPDALGRWARAGDDGDWVAWATSGDSLGARLRLVTSVASADTRDTLAVPVGGVDLPAVAGDPGSRDLAAALTTGDAHTAEVLVVAPRGPGRVRVAPPTITYQP